MGIKKPLALYAGIIKQVQPGDMTTDTVIASQAVSIGNRAESLAREAKISGVNGAVFITNIVPQSSGNVGNKVYSSSGQVLDSCVSDTQLVRVSILAITGDTHYVPNVFLEGLPVTLTGGVDKPLFTGTIDIDLNGVTELTVTHEDGAQHTCHIEVDVPPAITYANFTGNYPGSQTELKDGDTFNFLVNTDIPIVAIEFADYGAYKAQTFNVTSGTNFTVTGVIANRGTTTQSLGAKVRVQKASGSWSTWYLTETGGSVDKFNLVKLNNLYPTITIGTITYPATQQALKNTEAAIINNVVTNYNTITYSSPNGDLTITSPTAYQAAKTVNRLAGSYNVSTNNFRIVAVRAANNASTTKDGQVRIANVLPTITISLPTTRLRSGGNDGTSAQNYVVTITSNQNLLQAPSLLAGQGNWQGTAFAGSNATWTRTIQINDSHQKGNFSFSGLSAINLSGMEQTAINAGANYTIGGFVARQIALAAFANEVDMNVAVTDYTKMTLSWDFKSTLVNRQALDSQPIIVNGWCIIATGVNPTKIRILDTPATDSSSKVSYLTVEEGV